LRLASWQYIGFPPDPPEPAGLAAGRGRHYSVAVLLRMTVRRRLASHNEIVVTLQDGSSHTYGILDHSRTTEIRQRLSAAYPDLYSETGFHAGA
jgi:hypothetical protein